MFSLAHCFIFVETGNHLVTPSVDLQNLWGGWVLERPDLSLASDGSNHHLLQNAVITSQAQTPRVFLSPQLVDTSEASLHSLALLLRNSWMFAFLVGRH